MGQEKEVSGLCKGLDDEATRLLSLAALARARLKGLYKERLFGI